MGIRNTMDYVLAVLLLVQSFRLIEGGLFSVATNKDIQCKDPGLLQNGFREGSNFSYGAEVKYICKKGYIISGSPVRVCAKDGRWTGVEPFCNECAKVGTSVLVRRGNNFLFAAIVEKRFFIVTVMTNDPIYPQKDVDLAPGGQPYPMVEDRVPKLREIVIGSRVVAMNSAKGIFMLASVKGLKANGPIFHVLFADNTTAAVSLQQLRTLEQPTFCALCDSPETPENAYIEDELREFISGMDVTYKCRNNFVIDGRDSRKCLPNGQWSGVPPTCKDMCEKRNITCQEWEKCSYVTKDKPGCVCRQNIDCTALYKPICGSDGNMYNNYCIMKATACRQAKQIKQLNNSDCKPAGVCQIKPISPCRGYFKRFWYNNDTNKCESIIAGGCHPSGWNGFYTKPECEATCLVDVCTFAMDPGPCNSYTNRWAFDKKSGRCIKFKYGGCSGNENNFLTEDKCRRKCIEKDNDGTTNMPTSSHKLPHNTTKCRMCSSNLLSEACKIKTNTFAFVVKIKSTLAPDTRNRLLMYKAQIKKILFDNTQTLTTGKTILSVQYTEPGMCHCPKFTLKGMFLVMGHSPDGSKLITANTGLIVSDDSYVASWNKDRKRELKMLCKFSN